MTPLLTPVGLFDLVGCTYRQAGAGASYIGPKICGFRPFWWQLVLKIADLLFVAKLLLKLVDSFPVASPVHRQKRKSGMRNYADRAGSQAIVAIQSGRQRAPLHSITSSAMARSDGGTVMPSALAVAGFKIRSNLVGCSTGISLGFVPRRILSTKSAERLS